MGPTLGTSSLFHSTSSTSPMTTASRINSKPLQMLPPPVTPNKVNDRTLYTKCISSVAPSAKQENATGKTPAKSVNKNKNSNLAKNLSQDKQKGASPIAATGSKHEKDPPISPIKSTKMTTVPNNTTTTSITTTAAALAAATAATSSISSIAKNTFETALKLVPLSTPPILRTHPTVVANNVDSSFQKHLLTTTTTRTSSPSLTTAQISELPPTAQTTTLPTPQPITQTNQTTTSAQSTTKPVPQIQTYSKGLQIPTTLEEIVKRASSIIAAEIRSGGWSCPSPDLFAEEEEGHQSIHDKIKDAEEMSCSEGKEDQYELDKPNKERTQPIEKEMPIAQKESFFLAHSKRNDIIRQDVQQHQEEELQSEERRTIEGLKPNKMEGHRNQPINTQSPQEANIMEKEKHVVLVNSQGQQPAIQQEKIMILKTNTTSPQRCATKENINSSVTGSRNLALPQSQHGKEDAVPWKNNHTKASTSPFWDVTNSNMAVLSTTKSANDTGGEMHGAKKDAVNLDRTPQQKQNENESKNENAPKILHESSSSSIFWNTPKETIGASPMAHNSVDATAAAAVVGAGTSVAANQNVHDEKERCCII
eukprot:8924250-Ditylum_brightwellii.AAC.1